MKKYELNKYLELLTETEKLSIEKLIEIKDTEKRWEAIKSYFLKHNPKLVDNRFAWNLYRSTLWKKN